MEEEGEEKEHEERPNGKINESTN